MASTDETEEIEATNKTDKEEETEETDKTEKTEKTGETDKAKETSKTNKTEEIGETDKAEETEETVETNKAEETGETDTTEEIEESNKTDKEEETEETDKTEESGKTGETDETGKTEETGETYKAKETDKTGKTEETGETDTTEEIDKTGVTDKTDKTDKTDETEEKLFILHLSGACDGSGASIESRRDGPGGAGRFEGAARCKTMVDQHRHLNPLVFFGGNAFGASSAGGDAVVAILNSFGINAAVYGTRDFALGEDALEELAARCTFPWLLSNAFDRRSGRPLGKGKTKLMLERGGKKIGVVGLVEGEWIAAMSAVERSEVRVEDCVAEGRRLAAELREEGADCVIAMTNMRRLSEARLAAECREIDLYLGGHGRGGNDEGAVARDSDVCELSLVTVTFTATGKLAIDVQKLQPTSDIPENAEMQSVVDRYANELTAGLDEVVGHVGVELDGRYSSVRSRETDLGNLVCDAVMAALHADCVILNAGSVGSDEACPGGAVTRRDVARMAPFGDALVVLRCSGTTVLAALENAVSRFPRLHGRFAQVAGIRFAFEPKSAKGHRIDSRWVFVHEASLELDREYKVGVNAYMARGRDGYKMLVGCPTVGDEHVAPSLENVVLNCFRSADALRGTIPARSRHRQRVVAAATVAAVARHLNVALEDLDAADTPTGQPANPNLSALHDAVSRLEQRCCSMSPAVEGRIQVVHSDAEIREHIANASTYYEEKWRPLTGTSDAPVAS